MDNSIKKKIIIKTNSKEEEIKTLSEIHNQLVGNIDYIDNNIILNDSSTRNDNTENEIHLIIFNDCKTNPIINI